MAAAEKDKGEEERRGRGNRGRGESGRERAGRERARRKEREEAFTKERPGRKWLILGQVGGWHSRGRVWWEEADAFIILRCKPLLPEKDDVHVKTGSLENMFRNGLGGGRWSDLVWVCLK